MTLIQEKVDQAVEILKEKKLTCGSRSSARRAVYATPCSISSIGPNDLTWQSALIFTRHGDRIAVIGNLEKHAIASDSDVFNEILGYDTAVSGLLRDTIARLNPDQIAVNTSHNNVHADGLTHAMYEILRGYLQGHALRRQTRQR
jgi:hypothetical protein